MAGSDAVSAEAWKSCWVNSPPAANPNRTARICPRGHLGGGNGGDDQEQDGAADTEPACEWCVGVAAGGVGFDEKGGQSRAEDGCGKPLAGFGEPRSRRTQLRSDAVGYVRFS